MGCCICSPIASVYRPPRNAICQSCYEGAQCMTTFLKEIDGDEREPNSSTNTHGLRFGPSKGIADAFKRMKGMREMEESTNERLAFVDRLVSALKEGIHTDILVQPGNGSPIPAHKALLATRSEIFKTVFTSDECKEANKDTISLPELSHEELECLFSGTLKPDEIADTHACSLLIAADKYDIPFLKIFCRIGSFGHWALVILSKFWRLLTLAPILG